MNIDLLLSNHRLFIDAQDEEFAKLFCNTAGAETSRTKNRLILNNWYEGYLYCLLIGINVNAREYNGFTDRKDKTPKWSHNYLEQYKYAIGKLLEKPSVLNELGILDREAIKTNFGGTEKLLGDVKKICDQYSIGGLRYLKDKFEKDDTLFNTAYSLKHLYEESLL
jgi:hypothetical protein